MRKKMKRQDVLAAITAAAVAGDERGALRLYVEHRITYRVFLEAKAKGERIKERTT